MASLINRRPLASSCVHTSSLHILWEATKELISFSKTYLQRSYREQPKLKFLHNAKYHQGNLKPHVWNSPIKLPANAISPEEKKHAMTEHGSNRTWQKGNSITNGFPFPPEDKKGKTHLKGYCLQPRLGGKARINHQPSKHSELLGHPHRPYTMWSPYPSALSIRRHPSRIQHWTQFMVFM